MPEFVIRDSFWDHDLIVVSESHTAASMAFLKYLSARAYQICVLEHGFMKHHYLVIGEQNYFSAWLKDACDKAIRYYKPTFEYVASLENESVKKWAEDTHLKHVWVRYISHEHDDEFTRNVPTLRAYALFPHFFTTVLPEQEVEPALKEFEEAAYLCASRTKDEPV